jgi:hypothetical protein
METAAMNYKDAENYSWSDVRMAGALIGRLPLPVHIPLNKPFQDDLMICDAALNVWLLPVPPNMKANSIECEQIRNSMKVNADGGFGRPFRSKGTFQRHLGRSRG